MPSSRRSVRARRCWRRWRSACRLSSAVRDRSGYPARSSSALSSSTSVACCASRWATATCSASVTWSTPRIADPPVPSSCAATVTNARRTSPRTPRIARPRSSRPPASRAARSAARDRRRSWTSASQAASGSGEVDALATRAHGLEELVRRRGDEHDRAASRGLLDGLEGLLDACSFRRSASNRATTLCSASIEPGAPRGSPPRPGRRGSGCPRARTRPRRDACPHHEVLHSLVVVGCDDLGGEAAGGVLQPRTRGPPAGRRARAVRRRAGATRRRS